MGSDYERNWFLSADGIHRCALYIWRPVGPVRGMVQLVHGMREHMGRYGNFASFLCRQGYVVFGHDHLGHGQTVGKGETFGYFGSGDGCRLLIRDCHRAGSVVRRQYPYRPLFLLGHSMGSFIARLYILRYANDLAGFICMGTSAQCLSASYGRAIVEIISRACGGDSEGRFIDRLASFSYGKRFPGEDPRVAWLSRDPSVGEGYAADPYCTPLFTNSGYADLFTMMLAVNGKQWAQKVDKRLPILLVSGLDDPVGQYGKGVVRIYERLKLAGVLDVKCKLYPGARHELLNELNREEVYYDLLQWMEPYQKSQRAKGEAGQ